MSDPKDFVGDELLATFGMREYEVAMKTIILYLADEAAGLDVPSWYGRAPDWRGTGWKKKFAMSSVPTISPALFAMLCASGWIDTGFFPKYTFTLSDGAIARLEEHKMSLVDKSAPYWQNVMKNEARSAGRHAGEAHARTELERLKARVKELEERLAKLAPHDHADDEARGSKGK